MSGNLQQNWRVGHHGRDLMYYEENIDGAWHRLEVDGEMLMGRAHHVIYFASAGRWSSYPEWARHRRSGIITCIKSRATARQSAALLAVIAILLGITGGMGWLVGRGLQSGETWLPSKRASLQRVLSRQHEPASFHAALAVYALVGLGSGAAAWWAIREACHIRN